jgi:hypothetical protein
LKRNRLAFKGLSYFLSKFIELIKFFSQHHQVYMQSALSVNRLEVANIKYGQVFWL